MLLEFCAENFTNVPMAIKKGARRIELCDNLAVGGTTPSYGVIAHTVPYAHAHNATVVSMIRPRGGNFVFSLGEMKIMQQDIAIAGQLHADGIVLGCLTETNRIHREQTKKLLDSAGEMETTFHMAFDEIPRAVQKEELDWLAEQGVTRILTHGGRTGTVWDNADWLLELITYADNRIEILIGGGVTYKNVEEMNGIFQTDQFHGTQIVDLSD